MARSYRRHPYNTRNGAPTYTCNNALMYLDTAGSNPSWAIEVEGRQVYRMPPNPLDPDYNSCPNFDGYWVVVEAKPGAAALLLLLLLLLILCNSQARCRMRQ